MAEAYISRFWAFVMRDASSGVISALPKRRCCAFSAALSASSFSFFRGCVCSTFSFFGGERVAVRSLSSSNFSFGCFLWRTKSSVCSVRKSAKCDFFLNLMKKSLTFRLWQDPEIHPNHTGVSAGEVQSGIAGLHDADRRDGIVEFG